MAQNLDRVVPDIEDSLIAYELRLKTLNAI